MTAETGRRMPIEERTSTNWIVLTGPPSSGKDSTIADIEPFLQSSHVFIPETAARAIRRMQEQGRDFSDQRIAGLEISHENIEKLTLLQTSLEPQIPGIFNRAVPDVDAYAVYYKEDRGYVHEADTHRYAKVFYIEQLGIFENDGVRYEKDGLKFAQEMDGLLPKVYEESGYELIRVPKFPYEEVKGTPEIMEWGSRKQRALFILSMLGVNPDFRAVSSQVWQNMQKEKARKHT